MAKPLTIADALVDKRTEVTTLSFHGSLRVGSKKNPPTAQIVVPEAWIRDMMAYGMSEVTKHSTYLYLLVRVHRGTAEKHRGVSMGVAKKKRKA